VLAHSLSKINKYLKKGITMRGTHDKLIGQFQLLVIILCGGKNEEQKKNLFIILKEKE